MLETIVNTALTFSFALIEVGIFAVVRQPLREKRWGDALTWIIPAIFIASVWAKLVVVG